jgi:IS5 family transposase
LKSLIGETNGQLGYQNLKISNASAGVVDPSIIGSLDALKRRAMDIEDNGDVMPTPASKDKDAKWVKKAGRLYLGVKLHARSDDEGDLESTYLKGIHVQAANDHQSKHLVSLLDELPEGV